MEDGCTFDVIIAPFWQKCQSTEVPIDKGFEAPSQLSAGWLPQQMLRLPCRETFSTLHTSLWCSWQTSLTM